MVKFAKNGSDVTTAAVRLARAVTGRDMIAICDQPFYSTDDWFIGSTAMPRGVPADTIRRTVRFRYNDVDSLATLFAEHPGRIAGVVLEAATTTQEPAPGFLEGVRALCDRYGALLIFDEMITGFRWSAGGAQGCYGVRPDLSCWGKAMANGFPLSALAGRREFMELGGLRTDGERVFLLSTTHGPETASLAAFRAVRRAYATENPIGAMEAKGRRLAAAVNTVSAELGLIDYVQVIGRPSCLVYLTKDTKHRPSQTFRTLLLQEMLNRGVLGQSFVISAAHTGNDIDHTVGAVRHALTVYGKAIDRGDTSQFLSDRPVAPSIRSHAAPRQVAVGTGAPRCRDEGLAAVSIAARATVR
jgi:glutamate-1-semialdehyde 2,1-aminomutase